MGLESKEFQPKNSAHPINPLVKGRGGLPFTSNPPPLSKEEYPTQKDKDLANLGISTIDTKIVEFVGNQRGLSAIGVTGLLGAGGMMGSGITYLVTEVFAAENSIDINSFSNSFNNDGFPKLERLSPQLEQQSDNKVENPEDLKETLKKIFAEVEIIEVPGVISEKDIVRLPQEEIDRQFPNAFGKLREDGKNEIRAISQTINSEEKATLPDILVQVREDKGTLQLLYPLDLRESTNPNAKIEHKMSFSGFGKSVRDAFQGEGYYDGIVFTNVRGGTKILSPLDGFLVITQNEIPGNARPANGTADTDGVIIDFIDNNGNQYRIAISGSTKITVGNPQYPKTAFVFKNLTDAPVAPLEKLKEYNRQPIGSYGKLIKRGDPILEVIQPSKGSPVEVGMGVLFALKGTPEKKARPLSDPFIITNIEFITSDGKLIAPQKQ